MHSLESDADRLAFSKWWKDEVVGRQATFAPAFQLTRLDLVPPFHACWSNVKARRDKAAQSMSAAGQVSMASLWEALKDIGESWGVGPEAFAALTTWYGEHFPKSTAFLPQVLSLRDWPDNHADPPGPGDVEGLADQWGASLGRGTADLTHQCASALGLIGIGDVAVVYGVDRRDQLVTVVTCGYPNEKDLHRVSCSSPWTL